MSLRYAEAVGFEVRDVESLREHYALTLRHWARRLERHASGPSVEALFAEERAQSYQYGGRSVFGAEPPPSESSGRIRSGERSP